MDMGLPPEKLADLRIKHLEMVQTIISRMASYGSSFKGYCITVVTAVCGFALTMHRPAVIMLAFLPLIAFAIADTQYLRTERRFRLLYDNIRADDWKTMPTFAVSLKTAPKSSFWSAAFSWSILSFYTPLGIGVVIAIIGARWGNV